MCNSGSLWGKRASRPRAQQMTDAIKPAQRADLLQLALSPRRGRQATGSDTGQVASSRARGADISAVAERHDARGLFAGVASEGMGGVGSETQSDAVCRSESGGAAT